MADSFNLKQLETTLEEYLVKKAPAIPENLKEFIVKVAPWLTLVMIILLLPVILGAFGLGMVLMPVSYLGGLQTGVGFTVAMLVSGVTIVLEALAIPGLFKRQLSAWRLVFYATLLNALVTLLQGNLLGLIIGTGLGLYLLFQVKSYYK